MPRTRMAWLRHAFREVEARLCRLLGLPPVAVSVAAIRCPHCAEWVTPRRFDLAHMACRSCLATLFRPRRVSASFGGGRSCR
ncbi:hypothetical protein GCM10027605_65970 [Micromonospora zhanjiangensis]